MTSGVAAIVERQMRNWELARRQPPPPPDAELPEQMHHYVSVSRQMGSGGQEVARKLGQALGWTVYGREILDYMAGEDAVQRRMYALHDERHEGWITSIMDSLVPEKPQRRDDYFHKLARAICMIAEHENAVFLGRGAQFLLPSERGLRVRVVAPLSVCAANVAGRENLAQPEAEEKVRAEGRERDAYLKAHFVPEPWSSDHYDLVVNTSGLSTDGAVTLILTALGQKTGVRP